MPLSKDPEKRKIQIANLNREGRAIFRPKQKYFKAGSKIRIKGELSSLDIIRFCEGYLNISFIERPAQKVILKTIYGLPLSEKELEIFNLITKNEGQYSDEEKLEAILALGSRSGKSFLSALIVLYEAICKAHIWRKYLNPGEIGYAVVIATKLKQAQDIIGASCSRILEHSKIPDMIQSSYMTELTLTNDLRILSLPCNSTSGRGLPIFTLVTDELAFYQLEGPKADEKIIDSLMPRMAQFPRAKAILISSTGAKQGIFYKYFSEGFNVPLRATFQAKTRDINPMILQEFIDREFRRNPDNALREFGAEFAEKVEAFFDLELIQNCEKFAGDLPYASKFSYKAGIDQSGLAGRDFFSFAISHREVEKIIVDCIRSWRTRDIKIILGDIKRLKDRYNLKTVLIDRYARGYVEQALLEIGLIAEIRPSLSEIFVNMKNLALMSRLDLPSHQELRSGLQNTQGYYNKSNRLSIAHERSIAGHSDLADATASSVWLASKEPETKKQASVYLGEDLQEEESIQEFVDKSIDEISERRRGWDRFLD